MNMYWNVCSVYVSYYPIYAWSKYRLTHSNQIPRALFGVLLLNSSLVCKML